MSPFPTWIIISTIPALAGLVQTQPPPTVPQCVQLCLDGGFRNTGCGEGENWECACKKGDFRDDMTACIRSACTNEDETEIGENMVNIGCSNILTTSLTPPFSSPTDGGNPTNTTEFPPVPTIPNPRPPGASITLPKPPITTGPPISSTLLPPTPTSTSSSDSDISTNTSTRPSASTTTPNSTTSSDSTVTGSNSTTISSSLSPTMVSPPVTTVSMTSISNGSIQQVPTGGSTGSAGSSGMHLGMRGLSWTVIGTVMTAAMMV